MSVISSARPAPRRWLQLWPLALFLLLALAGGLWLLHVWPQLMLKSVVWQREVNQQMERPTAGGGGRSRPGGRLAAGI
ncbi:Uncharacterised protein [Pluralibacter gergoviae]|nr:Uncharacterised protein [Pluralibacter gergoviae]